MAETLSRAWNWCVTSDSMAASYAFASVILGGTFAGIVAFAAIVEAVL